MLLFWKRKPTGWSPATVTPPWGKRPSIYPLVKKKPDNPLPDEQEFAVVHQVHYAAGAIDGVFGHEMSEEPVSDRAKLLCRAFEVVLEEASETKLQKLYEMMKSTAMNCVDPLLEQMSKVKNLPVDRLETLAKWLVENAADREPLKFGIAILGIFPGGRNRELFMTLGAHDEFTLYAAVALMNTEESAEPFLFELAKKVHGWGRIHLLERLAGTSTPEIKDWIFYEGYKNSVMYEYLAQIAAETGDLRGKLNSDKIDDRLRTAAREILESLLGVENGSTPGLDSFQHGAEVVERYLQILGVRPTTIRELVLINDIAEYLKRDVDWAPLESCGWNMLRRKWILAYCLKTIALPHWIEIVERGLKADAPDDFFWAQKAAGVLGIDTYQPCYERIQAGKRDCWYFLMTATTDLQIEHALDLAVKHLPLEKIATGPAKELGLGPGYDAHSDLGYVLQELHRFPGQGWSLIQVGLKSPVTRNRYQALRALAAWDRTKRPFEIEIELRRAVQLEPDDSLQKKIEAVLEGRDWD